MNVVNFNRSWKVILVIMTTVVLCVSSIAIFLHLSTIGRDTEAMIALVNDDPITLAEFERELGKQRSSVIHYFKQTYGAEIDHSFWYSDYNGEVPAEMVKKRALEETVELEILFDWNNLREFKHFVFENLDIHSVRGEEGGGWHSVGIYLNGASRLFSSGNTIQGNMIYAISADEAVLLNTTDGLIENNVVFDTHKRAGGYHVPLWTWGTENAVIQYNEVFNTHLGGDAMAFNSDFRSIGTKIQYNYSHNNAGGFVLVINDGTDATNFNQDTIIRYNISQNDRHTIFTLAGPIENTLIHNNTIFQHGRYDGSLQSGHSRASVLYSRDRGIDFHSCRKSS